MVEWAAWSGVEDLVSWASRELFTLSSVRIPSLHRDELLTDTFSTVYPLQPKNL